MTDEEPTAPEILDRVADAFFALDDAWRFTYLNDRARELLDRDGEGLRGRVIWDVFPETADTPFPNQFHHAMDEGEDVAFETFYNPIGTWFEVRAYPSDTGLSVYLRDVSERKRRETEADQHAAIVEAVHDGVVTVNADDEIAYVNRAVEATFGVPRDRLVGTPVAALHRVATIDEGSTAALVDALSALRAGEDGERRVEATFEMADESTHVGEVRLVRIPGTDGGGVAGVIRDVTDRREYERVVTSLHGVTRQLYEADTPEEVCAVTVHTASELLDMPVSGVWLLDEERGHLDPVAATAGAHELIGGLPRFGRNEGLVWEAYHGGESALYDDVRAATDVYNPDTPIRSEIIAPIGDHGVLMTGARTVGAFDERDRELAEILAAQAELELDRAERERLLSERETAITRQSERLTALRELLDGEVGDEVDAALSAIEGAVLDPERAAEVQSALARADRLVDDAAELSTARTALGPRTTVNVADAIAAAGENVVDDETVPVAGLSLTADDDATLRADRDRLVKLFEALFRWSPDGRRADVRVGLLASAKARSVADGGYPSGFFVERADASAEWDGERITDPTTGPVGPSIAREIARAHGWEFSTATTPAGTLRFEVSGVTTLDPEVT
ncbi:PAS domain-containing protein [Halostella litorea]|uniref:PAS domain-containing protein n=1 Tax=Halostella litorea TaxID=2528831 RepID=UPI001092B6F5|nr:PAS domain-containing protein [Halostella litorea]